MSADGFDFSTDKSRLDFEAIYDFLSHRSYWAQNIPREIVQRSIDNALCFGVYERKKQVGFARLITDYATFAYLGDVFVLEEYRAKGLSKKLVAFIRSLPELQELRRWHLITRDAQGLYEQYGFKKVAKPEQHMEISRPNLYTEMKEGKQ
jgi:N-acetylglutamate synthase-like GNAT family acetyltransferase